MDYLTIENPLNRTTLSREQQSSVQKLLAGETISSSELIDILGGVGIGAGQITDGDLGSKINIKANYLQSHNFVTGTTGWRLDSDGNLEASSGTFRGSLIANTLHVPDENTTANSFHVESDGDTFWGCTQTNFTANNDNAKAYVLKSGVAKFQKVTYIGSVTQYVNFDETNIAITGVLNLIGTLQLKSYTVATLPIGKTGLLSLSAISGSSTWTNPANVYSSNDAWATTTTNGLEQAYKTWGLGNFPGTNIISAIRGITILGIEVKVECHGDAADMQGAVTLSYDSGISWVNPYKVFTPNNGADTIITLGGSSDLWNYAWTPGETQDQFLYLKIQMSDKGSGTTLEVDHITLRIYYSDPQNPVIAGSVAYVSDGRKAGEGAGNGSGVLVFYDEDGNWIACDTGATVAA